ncbi:MAG: beta-ketoacyl-ACP synthase III [Formosimonas sp.]
MNNVYINATAAFLPFEAVANDDIESVLGMIGGKPSRAKRIILRSNGITSRHYAIDRATGQVAMNNAQLTAQAIRELKVEGHVDVLATGTSTPDQLTPNHSVMVHGELGWPRLEAVCAAGICLAGTVALKHAWLAIKSGDAQRAVVAASELVSPQLMAKHFEAENEHKVAALENKLEIAFEKDFLRWMLSDGAGAFLLENQPQGDLSLKIEWIDLSSAAHELPTCMYSGADKTEDQVLHGWRAYSAQEWSEQSIFAIKQDVRLLNENIVRTTVSEPLAIIMQNRGLTVDDIDWFLPHISSCYFAEPLVEGLRVIGLEIPRERWFTNLTTCGNMGAASPFVILHELFQSGRIQKGQKILMYVPESGRFSTGFVYLEAV